MMKKLLIITASVATLILTGCQSNTPTQDQPQQTGDIQTGEITTGIQKTVSSFQECLEQGFPIMESYPRQCSDWTTTFTEELTQTGTSTTETTQTPENTAIPVQTDTQTSGSATTSTSTSDTKSTDLTALQQKLKAAVEKRNQASTPTSTSTTSTTTNTNTTTTTTTQPKTSSWVTEEDIETLENILDKIVE